jgi:lipopolysaccharide export LptBFGC system permease protein LptF
MQLRNLFVDMTTGLRDLDAAIDLTKYFLLALCFLIAVFITFTAFDIWKFAGVIDGGGQLLVEYLAYLLPYTYIQLAPSAVMIAVLATYVIKSRQNEIVTWAAAGQSIYRLLLPCFVLVSALGIVNWQIQEHLLPVTNKRQDDIRSFLRGGGKINEGARRRNWAFVDGRIYSFRAASDNETHNGSAEQHSLDSTASDNENRDEHLSSARDVLIFAFRQDRTNLQFLVRADSGVWDRGRVRLTGSVENIDAGAAGGSADNAGLREFEAATDPFAHVRDKPGQLTTGEMRRRLASSDSDAERRSLAIGIEKKYTTLVLPFVIALFTAPFALTLSRKGNAAAVGYAVGLWLLFTGISSVSEQLGLNGYLGASLAVWPPLVIFGLLGVYLLSRVRT